MILWGTKVKFTANKTNYEGVVLSSFQTQEGGWMCAVQCAANTIFMIPRHKLEIMDRVERPEKVLPTLSTGGKY